MNTTEWMALAFDPTLILKAQGIEPDAWQRQLLFNNDRQVMLCCSRGAGKTRTTSAIVLHQALFDAGSLSLVISRSQRQAKELLRYVKQAYSALGRPIECVKENETELEFANGSRIVALPGTESTIRAYQGVKLLVVDEAARVPDDLYASVSPMTAVKKGRTIVLSTPFGKRGFFYREWHDEKAPWTRFRVPWQRVPRITDDFIEEERRKFGDAWIGQEYECSFETMEGLVYPDFDQCQTMCINLHGKKVGGIDWGFKNPFVALEATLDHDDVLHINKEHYLRETPLHAIAQLLPKGYIWYADPAGRTEIEELRVAGHKVIGANNTIQLGIQVVTARIRTGRLKVAQNCVNLLSEAKLYRYPDESERAILGEKPIDEYNHAMDALRYLVMAVDKKFAAKLRRTNKKDQETDPVKVLEEVVQKNNYKKKNDLFNNPDAWTTL